MDTKYNEIISEFDENDRRVLKAYVKEIFEYKDSNEAEIKIKEKLQSLAIKLKEFEAKAIDKLDSKNNSPECNFCKKNSNQVRKLFKKNEYLHICNECVEACYAELQ